MNAIVAEWVAKAEADKRVAEAGVDLTPPPFDVVCYLAQQCAEKYLKAVLVELDRPFPKTHDLTWLAGLIGQDVPDLAAMQADLAELTLMAVQVRYPGFDADDPKMRRALVIAAEVRQLCRQRLALGKD